MKTISFCLNKLGIRSRLILTYIFMISIPMGVIAIRYYSSTRDMIFDITQKNVHKIISKDNEVIDSKLKVIKDNCWELMSDGEFIGKASSMLVDNDNIVSMDIELTNILNKYFMSFQGVSSSQLLTSYYAFGYSSTMGYYRKYIPIDSFKKSELYTNAINAKGKLVWVPTYEFSEMYNKENTKDEDSSNKYMFSAVQLMKTANMHFKNGVDAGESPILLVNLDEKFYSDIFKSSITMADSYFFVITKDGRYISHQDKSKIGKKEYHTWLEGVTKEESGQAIVKIDGKKMLICYDTSKETGWISVIAVDYNSLLNAIIASIKTNSVYVVIALTIIPIFIFFFVSYMITKPITGLSRAIKKTGDGDFSIKLPEEGSPEIDKLIRRFNSMNEKIQKLIQENYEIKIKEKEAEISALTRQLDPHFMYNTLNMINLKLIEIGQDDISEIVMGLSAMLKFNAKSKSSLVLFEQELDYLKGYISIMSKRLEGKFIVEYDIDPELYEYSVPKFLLQPFVENSLIHGFAKTRSNGVLKISGCISKDRRLFIIEDNGKGMSKERVQEIIEGNTSSVGINNVRKRIQIIYGDVEDINIQSEPAKGTKVTIYLPLVS